MLFGIVTTNKHKLKTHTQHTPHQHRIMWGALRYIKYSVFSAYIVYDAIVELALGYDMQAPPKHKAHTTWNHYADWFPMIITLLYSLWLFNMLTYRRKMCRELAIWFDVVALGFPAFYSIVQVVENWHITVMMNRTCTARSPYSLSRARRPACDGMVVVAMCGIPHFGRSYCVCVWTLHVCGIVVGDPPSCHLKWSAGRGWVAAPQWLCIRIDITMTSN